MSEIIDAKLRELALDALAGSEVQSAPSDPSLDKLKQLGTELWLDTGNLEEARVLWHSEFTALTTNNTLANQVVQTGVLDDIAKEAVADIRASKPGITDEEFVAELGFVVNCHIALRLVKAFGTFVSVELHPAVSEDIDRTVAYAERYYAVCPERFIIKIPLTPEGYCSTARVRAMNIPVNYTLGFSARQNYLAAALSNPTYCNVFLGRLNAVVSDNKYGDGKNVGERTVIATQNAIRELRDEDKCGTKLIAASLRSASQVSDLAGVDVYTMPPKVAKGFIEEKNDPEMLSSKLDTVYATSFNDDVDATYFDSLWNVDEKFKAFTDSLVAISGVKLIGDDLRDADLVHGTNLFHYFTEGEATEIRTHGKIPEIDRWADDGVSLETLMTEAALQSFIVDQGALDAHLLSIIQGAK